MTEYEKAMLKLKMLELTQRQAILAVLANGQSSRGSGSRAEILAIEGEEMLTKALHSTGKLLS